MSADNNLQRIKDHGNDMWGAGFLVGVLVGAGLTFLFMVFTR